MDVDIRYSPSLALGVITLPPGGEVKAEAGAMTSMSGGVEIQTGTQGGLLKGWKSTLLSGEGLVATFTGPGELWLQTRSPVDFVGWLTPQLPSQQA